MQTYTPISLEHFSHKQYCCSIQHKTDIANDEDDKKNKERYCYCYLLVTPIYIYSSSCSWLLA